MSAADPARETDTAVPVAGTEPAKGTTARTDAPAPRAADQRLWRAGEPRLVRIRTAVARDMERIKSAAVADVPGVLLRLDEVARQVDDLPLANAVGPAAPLAGKRADAPPQKPQP